MKAISAYCNWREDCGYHSSCKFFFIFDDGGPLDNGFKFCPNCGKEIVEWMFHESGDALTGMYKERFEAYPEFWENEDGDRVWDVKEIS